MVGSGLPWYLHSSGAWNDFPVNNGSYIYIEYWIIDNILKVHVHKGFFAKAARVPTWDPAIFFWVCESIFLFGERNGESLFSWWDGLSALIFFLLDEVRTFWIVIGRHAAKNRPKHYIVIKWSWTPNRDSGPGFSDWFAKDFLRKSRETSAKAAKEKVSMEASSPHSTFAAASQGNVVNNEPLLFPGGIFPTLGRLPDPSHSYRLHAVWCISTAQKWIAATPRRINVGLAKVFLLAKNGRLQIEECGTTATHIYTYIYMFCFFDVVYI